MKTLIVFYSRTGTTAKVARGLADALGAEIAEIGCRRYRPGGLRYLRAGHDSLRGRLPPIEVRADRLSDYDLVILGAPIWTSYPAVPLRAFLDRTRDLPAHVALFLTHGGHSEPRKAVDMVAALVPTDLEATLLLRQEDVDQNRHLERLDRFAEKLSGLGRDRVKTGG
ncbi:MAG: flavodoxin family protein [Inquilinaceae bacterium]